MRLREDQWIPVGFLGARVPPARGAPQSLGMFKLLPKSVGRKVKTSFLLRKSHGGLLSSSRLHFNQNATQF